MKRTFTTVCLIMLCLTSVSGQITIPDQIFLQTLLDLEIDINNDGIIQSSEAESVTSLTVSNLGIENLSGIEAFINLDTLNCSSNKLTSLDLSKNTALTFLYCSINKLDSLDLSKNIKLRYISCSNNKLTSLVLPRNADLMTLDCGFNKLTSLDVSANIGITILECYSNLLDSLNIAANTALINLYCDNNHLSRLDLSHNIHLTTLNCSYNKLTAVNLSKCTGLTVLSCYSNLLDTLDVSNNTSLVLMDCGVNMFSYLDLSHNISLASLDCADSPNLKYICVANMSIVSAAGINFYKDADAAFTEDCSLPTVMENPVIFNNVQLSPNPSNRNFILTLSFNADISISNIAGSVIESFASVQHLQFGQNYPEGIYFVYITSGNSRKVMKIVKG